jgi:ABC-type nitrate/sulfonate/bicarbonate transport system substrate-binding protein
MSRVRGAALFLMLSAMLAPPMFAAEAVESTVIRFGISPWFSTNVRFQQTMIKPMVDVLKSFGLASDYQSASDNVQFVRAATDGRYDVVFVPANIGALLTTESGFRPLVGYHLPQDFAVYVSKDSALRSGTLQSGKLDSLKGKRVGMPDEFGLIAMQALETFQKQGLLPGGLDVRYEKYDQLVVLLFQHAVDAIVINPHILVLLEPAVRDRLVQIYQAPEIDLKLTHVYLIAPHVPPDVTKKVEGAFLTYHENSDVRNGIAQDGRYLIDKPTPDDLAPALRYAGGLRQRLKNGVAMDGAPPRH